MIIPLAIRKAGYGALFTVILPVLLVSWAMRTSDLFVIPTIRHPAGGSVAAAVGVLLMIWGIAALWSDGGGLPMNAFPPPRFVTRGVYAMLPHPIYAGFVLVCFGISILTGSASAFWLVSPAVALASIALVVGYERLDLRQRFGESARAGFCWLPARDSAVRKSYEIALFYATVVIPWILIYELIQALGRQPLSVDFQLGFERRMPILEWTEWLYASTYLVVVLAPIALRTRAQLRGLFIRGWCSMALVFPLYVLLPSLAPRGPFVPEGAAGALLDFERQTNVQTAAFPSYHVIWSIIAAESLASAFPRCRWWWRTWAAVASAACVTTGMHSIADVAGGIAVALSIVRAQPLWNWVRSAVERLANSWREWRLGPVRIINHGLYAGAGTFIAYCIVGAIAGPGSERAVAFTAVAALCGAGAWAQWIEGSPRLLRPYGFYGGITGVIVAAPIAAALFGTSAWLLLAAHCVAAPCLQSFGRLRCLVQGCCHGAPAPADIGIRYHHPRSRVTRLAGLANVPVHPTPLYSILWNIPIALVMTRLWVLGSALHLICGVYLILTGVGRFVEEAYRGEPQTPVLGGLRLYQWIAIGTIIAGAVITAVFESPPAPLPQLTWGGVANAAALGLIATAALGVDFPESNRRLARLT